MNRNFQLTNNGRFSIDAARPDISTPRTVLEEKQSVLAHLIQMLVDGYSTGVFCSGTGGSGKPGGQTTVELPQEGEELFLYIVGGEGQIAAKQVSDTLDLYDVVLATPQAEAPQISAGTKPLNYLSFYLKPFMNWN